MSATSSIEWTDRTWNPVRGCSVISPGCVNCYAMKFAHRFSAEGKPYAGLTKQTKAGPQWTGIVRPIEAALLEPARWRKPARVFVNSMSDLFHESLDPLFIGRVFNVMAAEPRHTFQVLTKRPARMLEVLTAYYRSSAYGPIPNVWLGVSVEDQKHADERIPLLLQTPAAVRFISAEPLLGPVDLRSSLRTRLQADYDALISRLPKMSHVPSHLHRPANGLDWVIVGGESGPGARPFDLTWARSLVQQCHAARVACFVKQLGAKPLQRVMYGPATFEADQPVHLEPLPLRNRKGGDISEWPEDLRVRQFPEPRPAWDGRERRRWNR